MKNNLPPCYKTVARLVNYLEQKGLIESLALGDEDLADVLWLAHQIGGEKVRLENPDNSTQTTTTTTTETLIKTIEDEANLNDGADSKTEQLINIYPEDSSKNKDYDMHGNVWEWCEDDYHDNYERAPDDGRAWIDTQNPNFD